MARGLEQMYGPYMRGPLTSPMSLSGNRSPWCGLVTVNSGDTSVVVSTAIVGSDSMIFTQLYNATNAASGAVAQVAVVKSVVVGVSFTLGRHDGQSMFTAGSGALAWWMVRGS